MNNWRAFVSFLKEEGAWEAYKKNIRAFCRTRNKRVRLREPLFWFLWTDTPEGLQYWNDLNNEWRWKAYEQQI